MPLTGCKFGAVASVGEDRGVGELRAPTKSRGQSSRDIPQETEHPLCMSHVPDIRISLVKLHSEFPKAATSASFPPLMNEESFPYSPIFSFSRI